jgi:hypothetical protein
MLLLVEWVLGRFVVPAPGLMGVSRYQHLGAAHPETPNVGFRVSWHPAPPTYIYIYIYIYIYENMLKSINAYIYIYIYSNNKRLYIFVIKDAHQFKDSIACPETSVRVCFGG